MRGDVRAYLEAIYDDWKSLLGGIASIVLTAFASVGQGPLPAWTFWFAAFLCLVFASFRIWRQSHRNLLTQLERLKPRLEFRGITESADGFFYRVRVRNLSTATCNFWVNLTDGNPPITAIPLPYPLQITHHRPGDVMAPIGGHEERTVDVFRTYVGVQSIIQLEGTNHKQNIVQRRQEFTLCAHCEGAGPVTQKFIADFGTDGSVKFWAA